MSSEQQYISLYEQCRDMICRHSASVLNQARDEAFGHFQRYGFESRKVERYRYTDLQKLFEPDYGLNLNRLEIPVNPYDSFRCDVPSLSTSLYFMVNDAFHSKSLPKTHLPEGVMVGSLRETAVKVERTIQVINILRADVDLMVNRRVLIVMEEGSEAKLLFCDHAADDRHFLATQVTEAYVGKGASLELYCMEETHHKSTRVSNLYVEQQAESRLSHNIITLHNGVTRNRADVVLKGEGAQCQLNGCALADKTQHVDNNTLIDHAAPHGTSHELYKYVLDDNATGAFAGKVLVRHGAQKTESAMTNQNLCATKTARMFTQPMLEIYADDVKCAHGSTVGQLNEAALFYMQQRGISRTEALHLLQAAFIYEVIDSITLVPLRDRLRYLVDKRLRGELNKCDGCKLCQ